MNLNATVISLLLFEVLIVGAVVGIAGYEIVHNPDGDLTKQLVGALLTGFGIIVSHLFGNVLPTLQARVPPLGGGPPLQAPGP